MTARLNSLHYAGSDWTVGAADLEPALLYALMDCCPGGQDASPYVEDLMSHFQVTGKPEDCAAYLRGYGAWDEEELSDHDGNLARLVWLTGCALNDGEVAYFSTY